MGNGVSYREEAHGIIARSHAESEGLLRQTGGKGVVREFGGGSGCRLQNIQRAAMKDPPSRLPCIRVNNVTDLIVGKEIAAIRFVKMICRFLADFVEEAFDQRFVQRRKPFILAQVGCLACLLERKVTTEDGSGIEGVRQWAALFCQAFPDTWSTADDVIVEGGQGGGTLYERRHSYSLSSHPFFLDQNLLYPSFSHRATSGAK